MENIRNEFKVNTPILTAELLDYFKDKYSRSRTFQIINMLEEEHVLTKYSKGVYYICENNYKLSIDEVLEKKYLKEDNQMIGLYTGEALVKSFTKKNKKLNTIEVVTNNETNILRELSINDKKIVLRRSRCEINNDNIAAYTLLELFSQSYDKKNKALVKSVESYINENEISSKKVVSLAGYFPSRTFKNLLASGMMDKLN